jgi:hypothetical protein
MPTLSLHPSKHSSERNGAEILAVVDHATVGSDSLAYLTENSRKVSAHALITKQGHIYRMVPDDRAAHHVGSSQIRLRQRIYGSTTTPTNNQVTLGIELENWNNGKDPYPAIQIASLGWLHVDWLERYPDITFLKHRDIDTQGKSDPYTLSWARIHEFMAPWLIYAPAGPYRVLDETPVWERPDPYAPIAWGGQCYLYRGHLAELYPLADGPITWLHWPAGGFVPRIAVEPLPALPQPAPTPPAVGYEADSPILGTAPAPESAILDAFASICAAKGSPYARMEGDPLRNELGPAYARHCAAAGVNLLLALGQCAHETGWLTSALSQPVNRDGQRLHNLAGIGVTEAKESATPHRRPGTVYDADAKGYRPASTFPTLEAGVIGQVGRLILYARPPGQRSVSQQTLALAALASRALPMKCQGSAPTLRALGSGPNPVEDCGWAGAGELGGLDYGRRVAAAANSILARATLAPAMGIAS